MKTVHKTCSMCDKSFAITAPAKEFAAWESGMLIQRAMSSLSEDERELLISGICGKCFDWLFSDNGDPSCLHS